MDRLYECDKANKTKLEQILNENPYDKDSFAVVGYILKDGKDYGFEGKMLLYISANEEFIRKADERLKDVAVPVPEEKARPVIERIKSEESSAEQGFGAIFG